MIARKVDTGKYSKFLIYLVVVVLLNIAGITLFFRLDLTTNKVYSLSDASRNVVATLSEPLTVKVFFNSNLPAPYNNIERYLHDLLEEYAVAGNKYFNYQFYNVSGEKSEEPRKNQEIAMSYGIQPVQIQNVEQDEVKFQKAYMGMALIHGDIIETFPTITSTEGLEYQITSKIKKMNNKISALLRLKGKITVKLFLSSSLRVVGPYMNISGLAALSGKIEETVNKLNGKNYGRLSFIHLDPSANSEAEKEAERYNILRLNGTQYQLADMAGLEKTIDETIESVIDINEQIGYLADHGTLTLGRGLTMPGQPQQESLSSFNKLLSEQYSLTQVNLKEKGIPEGLSFMIIAGAKEIFSDYELYQIDQFLMNGNSLAIFMDSFNEVTPQSQHGTMGGFQRSFHMPLNTGLEKLLNHYGLNVKKSIILDENCYKQRMPQSFGGGERPIYFAPVVKNELINKDAKYLINIKGLVMLKSSPVDIDEQKIKDGKIKATKLFSSSGRSWEMSGRINLNPMFINPPKEEGKFKSMAMAYTLEGPFTSYFTDKPSPEKKVEDEKAKDSDDEKKQTEGKESGIDMSKIKGEDITIKKGKPAKIFLIGTSEILKDNVIDEKGKTPNAQFIMNVIDFLNDREETAVMRSKTQRFNPLKEVSPSTRTVIKTANIAGLPVLVIVAGIVVWGRRASRKRMIQRIFSK
jgi:ABC-type uncharacterized transport system involved in gliding motility auxiliary subunit